MRELLNTLGKTLLDIGNFGMLLVLFMYIYALVGLQIFANRFHFDKDGVAVGIGQEGYHSAEIPRSNFDTLMKAFTTIFEVHDDVGPDEGGGGGACGWGGGWQPVSKLPCMEALSG